MKNITLEQVKIAILLLTDDELMSKKYVFKGIYKLCRYP
jgi:hypothetical protein